MRALVNRVPRLSALQLGALLLGVSVLAGVLLFNKAAIGTALKPGDEFSIEVERDYRLRSYQSRVKIAGIPVGVVTGVEKSGENAKVTMKLDKGAMERLGTTPSAAIRPTTLLGGNYYVALVPGGDPGTPDDTIPAARTTVPVELDRVLEQVGPEQREGLRTVISQLEQVTGERGRSAAQALVADAPETLAPAGVVLEALQGSEPADDLAQLVSGLEGTGRALAREQGELAGMLSAGAGAAETLAGRADAVASTIADGPETLAATRAALGRLERTMGTLRDTAPALRPSVVEAARLLETARPLLTEARPVVSDLRLLARDLRPLLADAVPVVREATAVTKDLDGPVIGRVKGPVLSTVLSPYRGKTPFYEELGYMIAGLGATAKMTDAQGASIAFHPGPGVETVGGLPPLPIDAIFADLLGLERTGR